MQALFSACLHFLCLYPSACETGLLGSCLPGLARWQLHLRLQGGRLYSEPQPLRNKPATVSMCWGFVTVFALVPQSINLTEEDVHLECRKPEGLHGQPVTVHYLCMSLWSSLVPLLPLPLICLITLNKALFSGAQKIWMCSDQS